MRKRNCKDFSAKVNGEVITFNCYTTDTRSGFCHTASVSYDSPEWALRITDTKASYYNRTWERFDYESVLKKAIAKFPKGMQDTLRAQLIEGKAAEEHEKAVAFLDNFEKLYDGLNDENKARMANLPPIENEDTARMYMGFMGFLTLTQK